MPGCFVWLEKRLGQLPFAATGAVEEGVGFGVAGELIFFGIPFQIAPQLIAMVGEAAENAGMGAERDIGHGVFAAADTVDPVAAMAFANIRQTPVILTKGRFDRTLRIGGYAAAIDE